MNVPAVSINVSVTKVSFVTVAGGSNGEESSS
jgi:hypothetical protein